MAASSVGICRLLRLTVPGGNTAMPFSMASSTVRTISFAPSSAARRSRNSLSSGKWWPVSTLSNGIGNSEGRKAFFRQTQQADGILAAAEKDRGPLELRRHLAHDVDGLGFENREMI